MLLSIAVVAPLRFAQDPSRLVAADIMSCTFAVLVKVALTTPEGFAPVCLRLFWGVSPLPFFLNKHAVEVREVSVMQFVVSQTGP